MLKKIILSLLVCLPFTSFAQQSREDFELSLKVMEQQGVLRPEGTHIIYLHMNPGDTAFYRQMYRLKFFSYRFLTSSISTTA